MKTDTKAYYLGSINRAIEFIESHASEKIGLEEIAEYALLSKFHFHRIFKSIKGETVKDYLLRIRLEKSAFLLMKSDKPINEIAYECGYSSPETFTRAFRAYFSISPSQYKSEVKEKSDYKREANKKISFESLQLKPPKIVEKADLNLAYIRHQGRYEEVGKSFKQLIKWASKQLLLKWIPTTIGIVYDDPNLTAEEHLRYDACILLSREIKPEAEIGYKQIKAGRYAVFRYKGPYEELSRVYDYIYYKCLFEYDWELRDAPSLEWYIRSPLFFRPKDLVTDIYLPIV